MIHGEHCDADLRRNGCVCTDTPPAGPVSVRDLYFFEAGVEEGRNRPPSDPAAPLREAIIHAARDVDGLWFPQDDNWTGTDLTFWGPEAGEALRDLRDAVTALDDAEARAALALTPKEADPSELSLIAETDPAEAHQVIASWTRGEE